MAADWSASPADRKKTAGSLGEVTGGTRCYAGVMAVVLARVEHQQVAVGDMSSGAVGLQPMVELGAKLGPTRLEVVLHLFKLRAKLRAGLERVVAQLVGRDHGGRYLHARYQEHWPIGFSLVGARGGGRSRVVRAHRADSPGPPRTITRVASPLHDIAACRATRIVSLGATTTSFGER